MQKNAFPIPSFGVIIVKYIHDREGQNECQELRLVYSTGILSRFRKTSVNFTRAGMKVITKATFFV
jgi:hypothetical protein